jgi:hypothetical protein
LIKYSYESDDHLSNITNLRKKKPTTISRTPRSLEQLGAFCRQTKCKKKMFSRRQVLSKIHVLSRVDRTIGFKTGLSGFVLELAFLLVSCLLDNVFMNNNKNKNLIIKII